ncbi:uncharacterized protein EDB91DRAFT_217443 [Suillus paluster]|uniref:uncharacterized protein n=1 Tax=Suillus paluster TaxID=48578 RepID=UPI001B880CD0|nr:uncharacterized protein EDB91DRAFT_217443 [Suillus paluster]KAG1743563.1 hypothetical protein EDB91DRAFT_217443 [Suillus paluster]
MHCLLLMFLLRRGKECNAAAGVKTMFLLLHRNLTTTIRRRRTAWKWPVVRLLLSGLDDVRVSILLSFHFAISPLEQFPLSTLIISSIPQPTAPGS